jgi:hypothetical protein
VANDQPPTPAQLPPTAGPAQSGGPKPDDEPGQKADDKSGDKADGKTDAASAPDSESERDSAVRELQGKALALSQNQMDKYVARGINQLNAETINIFASDYEEEFDGRRSNRRAGKTHFTKDDLDNETESFVEPPRFRDELNLLADRNLVVLAGPARTGKRTRALELLRRTLAEADLGQAVEDLPVSVLANPAWRVPREGTGFVVFDSPSRSGGFAAAKIGEEWLVKSAQRLHETGSYLVVVTGPVAGSLAEAPNRPEFVLDEWELPDSQEILRRRLRDLLPSEAEDLIERLAETELAELLVERDSPGFAVRAAKEIIEGHRLGRDLTTIVAKLANAEGLVEEWISREPDAKELSLVLATAVLDNAGYLKMADAAVALHKGLNGGGSAPLTLRYTKQLLAEHTWIQRVPPGDQSTALTVRFRHAKMRPAVLGVIWRHYDGARSHILAWLEKLAVHTDPEVRAGTAQAVGFLARQDFQHGVHEYLLRWGWDSSMLLRQTAARGLNVAGMFGNERTAWSVLEEWAGVAYSEDTENLCTTAALAAGGPLGVQEPRRALGVLRDFVLCEDKWDILWSVAVSAGALLEAGCAEDVLDALHEWTGPGASKDALVKSLSVFISVMRPETDDSWPLLLRAADENRKHLSALWSRAMSDRSVQDQASDALRAWVRRVDDDPNAKAVVLGLIADIADEGPADKLRVVHALSQWAQDRYQPSVAAATFYDLMYEAEEEVP